MAESAGQANDTDIEIESLDFCIMIGLQLVNQWLCNQARIQY